MNDGSCFARASRSGRAPTEIPTTATALKTALALLLAAGSAAHAAAATFYVDGSNPACSDAGPGTEAAPYCTITGAMTGHNGPGVTILVKPGLTRAP